MWGLGRVFEEGYKDTYYNRLYREKENSQKVKMRKIMLKAKKE